MSHTSSPRYLRHWEFPTPTGEALLISELPEPNSVRITSPTGGVVLTESQFRAIASLIGYGTDCIQFQPESEPEPKFEPNQ